MSFRLPLLVMAVTFGVVGCRSKPVGPSVRVQIDDGRSFVVGVGEAPVLLASKLPRSAGDPAAWLYFEATAPDGRFVEVARPAEAYGAFEARLQLDRGKPTLGFFRLQKPDLEPALAAIVRQPVISLPDVETIRIWTREPAVEVPDVALEIRIPGRESWTIDAAELATLDESSRGARGERADDRSRDGTGDGSHQRTGDSPRDQGWQLRDVVGLRVPVEHVARLHVEGDGASVAIERAELDAPRRPLVIKRNRRGELVFRGSSEVRGVRSIRVEPRSQPPVPGAAP